MSVDRGNMQRAETHHGGGINIGMKFFGQTANESDITIQGSQINGSEAIFLGFIDIGAEFASQAANNIDVTLFDCHIDGGPVVLVGDINIDLEFASQAAYHINMSILGRQKQWCTFVDQAVLWISMEFFGEQA